MGAETKKSRDLQGDPIMRPISAVSVWPGSSGTHQDAASLLGGPGKYSLNETVGNAKHDTEIAAQGALA